jgi:RND family efflux transporter MFP subunit
MAQEELGKLRIDKQQTVQRPARKSRVIMLVMLIFAVIGLAVLASRGAFSPAVEVEIATVSLVYPSQTFTLLNASGYVVAQRKAAVASKATGRLDWLGVEEGSRVRQGDILARLDNRDVEAARDQAAAALVTSRAALDEAKAELQDATLSYNRQKDLVSQGITARAEFDVAEARYRRAQAAVSGATSAIKGAEAALKGAEVAIEHTLIRAPFDGVVLTKNADVGDIVTPLGAAANAKAAVVTLADMESLMVETDVSEANLEKVNVGQPCEILLDAFPETRFRGLVHTIVPTADRSKATVMVKVRFVDRDRRVLPEMSAKVAFLERPVRPDEQKPRTALNPATISSRDGRSVVFKVAGNRAVETTLRLGAQLGEMREVMSGIKAGEKIVLKPLEKLRNDSRIKVADK